MGLQAGKFAGTVAKLCGAGGGGGGGPNFSQAGGRKPENCGMQLNKLFLTFSHCYLKKQAERLPIK